MAAKLTKNLGPPSSTLHVANLPEELNHNDIKVIFNDVLDYVCHTCGTTDIELTLKPIYLWLSLLSNFVILFYLNLNFTFTYGTIGLHA